MRTSTLSSFLSAALLLLSAASTHVAAQDAKDATVPDVSKEAGADDDSPKPTTFNGMEVPPMRDLAGDTLNEEISKGYWYGPVWEQPQSYNMLILYRFPGS